MAFVPLAPIRDAGLVIPTVAQTLGVAELAGRLLIDRLKRYLHNHHMLLLLDNFEQVLEAAPQIADVLAAAPRLTVLVTSRTVLRISGEHRFAVPPLALPELNRLPTTPDPVATTAQSPAVELFVQIALVTLLLAQAALLGWHIALGDPHVHKQDGLMRRCTPLSGHCFRQAATPDEIAQAIRFVDKIGRRRVMGDQDRTPVLLILDEFTNLVIRKLLPDDVLDPTKWKMFAPVGRITSTGI